MSTKSATVEVVDHVPFTATIVEGQPLAYARRVLVGWKEHPASDHLGRNDMWSCFEGPVPDKWGEPTAVYVPLRALADWPRRIAELCSEMVDLGIAAKPSDILSAMAAEVVK